VEECADSLEASLNAAVSRRSTFVTLPFSYRRGLVSAFHRLQT